MDSLNTLPSAQSQISAADAYRAMLVQGGRLRRRLTPALGRGNMAEHTIYFIGGEDDESGLLTSSQHVEGCMLSLAFRGRQFDASGQDLFETFCQIRLQLEQEGLIPFCYGASLNVYPSRMSREMSGGMAAYRLTSGVQATRENLVSIFDQEPDVIPSSVANQKAFYTEWLASLGA